jgi:hypothetical protein
MRAIIGILAFMAIIMIGVIMFIGEQIRRRKNKP